MPLSTENLTIKPSASISKKEPKISTLSVKKVQPSVKVSLGQSSAKSKGKERLHPNHSRQDSLSSSLRSLKVWQPNGLNSSTS